MIKNNLNHNKQKGMAMALALLFSVILLGLGLALAFIAYFEQSMSNYSVIGTKAFYPSDVETAYLSIGRTVISKYDNWSSLLGAGAASNCTINNIPTQACSDQIPSDYRGLQGPWCKGRILRVPPSETWDLTNETKNPFSLRCNALADGSNNGFCNCRIILPDKSFTQSITLYVRNDIQDGTILQDNNGEIQLIAVGEMPSLITAKTILAYDLSAWTTEAFTYDIHQTGSIQIQ